eukprot:gene4202-4450_t
MASIPPNQTIYVQNLYEKLPKEELRKALYAMFSQFGKILDVVALKTLRLRGQAWIVFSDVAAATNAKNTMQGFPFFDKPIVTAWAVVMRMRRMVSMISCLGCGDEDEAYENLIKRVEKRAAVGGAGAAAGGGQLGPDGHAPPNKILFAQNLPEATTGQMLTLLFQQYPGFMEVRMIDARPGIAFIEFDSDLSSTTAMTGLQNFKITPEKAMQLSYAKQ